MHHESGGWTDTEQKYTPPLPDTSHGSLQNYTKTRRRQTKMNRKALVGAGELKTKHI